MPAIPESTKISLSQRLFGYGQADGLQPGYVELPSPGPSG
jgi:hypothetical protein